MTNEPIKRRIVQLRQHIDGSPQDEYLFQLLTEVWSHPEKSQKWRRAMHQLLLEIQKLPKLARCSHSDYPDVLNDTLLEVKKKIKDFNPKFRSLQVSLVAWVNIKLRLKFKVWELYSFDSKPSKKTAKHKTATQEYEQEIKKPPLSLDIKLRDDTGQTFAEQLTSDEPSLEELEEQVTQWQIQQTNERIGRQVWDYIELDPQQRLQNCYANPHPHCHCQEIAKRRLLKTPPDKYGDIAKNLNVPQGTLTAHWHNKCKSLLKEIANSFGYQPQK